MRLGDFFKGQSTQISGSAQTAQTQTPTPARSALMNQQIRSLAPGQTLQGEVVSKNGGEVQIKVSDDFTLNARLEQNMNIEVGRNLTFEVKNNGSALTLSPLFTNTATDANIMKALDMASLPVNEVTVNMTEQMMSAGLSIDKNSLQQMFREVNAYPRATSVDLVNLHKLEMPINEQNINQMMSYRNLTHQLISGMTDVLSELPEVFSNLLSSGDVEGAVTLYQALTELADAAGAEAAEAVPPDAAEISEEGQNGGTSAVAEQAAAGEGAIEPGTGLTAEGMEDIALPSQGTATEAGNGKAAGVGAQQPDIVSGGAQDRQGGSAAVQTRVILDGAESLQQGAAAGKEAEMAAKGQNVVLTEDNPLRMSEGASDEISRAVADAEKGVVREMPVLTAQNAPEMMEKLAQGERNTQLLRNLLEPLSERLLEKWTLEPSDVEDTKEIENLYNRLNSQLKSLTQALEKGGQTETAAYKAVTNMSQNLDFMNQVNQMYAYVQLPLRLQQGNAHGDLYVYTNKKNLAMKDGQISALLHLDMEHLGPVDVYVAMQSDNVNTRFYVQDDSMLDFLEEHMDLLTERLQKRGYNCSLAMQVRGAKQEESGIDQLLEQDNSVPLVEYAFDVRT